MGIGSSVRSISAANESAFKERNCPPIPPLSSMSKIQHGLHTLPSLTSPKYTTLEQDVTREIAVGWRAFISQEPVEIMNGSVKETLLRKVVVSVYAGTENQERQMTLGEADMEELDRVSWMVQRFGFFWVIAEQ